MKCHLGLRRGRSHRGCEVVTAKNAVVPADALNPKPFLGSEAR